MERVRINDLAKELGVDSEDIIVICLAEGVPADMVKSGMSTITVDVAQSVREWFAGTLFSGQDKWRNEGPVSVIQIDDLARELGVRSEDIISKCQFRGVPRTAIQRGDSIVPESLAQLVRKRMLQQDGPFVVDEQSISKVKDDLYIVYCIWASKDLRESQESRGLRTKCPACGSKIDAEAYRCQRCLIYFCFECRRQFSNGDRQFHCGSKYCVNYAKLICGSCECRCGRCGQCGGQLQLLFSY